MENTLFWSMASFAILLFIIGVYALLATRNLLRILIGVEVLNKGVTLLLIMAGFIAGRTDVIQPVIITMIVIEAVIIATAAGVVIAAYRRNGTIDIRALRDLKG